MNSNEEPAENEVKLMKNAWQTFLTDFSGDDDFDRYFAHRNVAFYNFWLQISKYYPNLSTICGRIKHILVELIGLHQEHLLQSALEVDHYIDIDRTVTVIESIMKILENFEDKNFLHKFSGFKAMLRDPWKASKFPEVVTCGKTEPTTIDYFLCESFSVCKRRLSILLKGETHLVCYRFTMFLVSTLFNSDDRKTNPILANWESDAVSNCHSLEMLLDLHLALMYKLGREKFDFRELVSFMDTYAVIRAAYRLKERYTEPLDEENRFEAVWTLTTMPTALDELTNFLMETASKKSFENNDNTRKIAELWLDQYPMGSTVLLQEFKGLEIEKKITELPYVMCNVILEKAGPGARTFVVETFAQVFCHHYNRMDIARQLGDQKVVREMEKIMSKAFVMLGEILSPTNQTAYRECILTAFSLNPTEELFKLVKTCARESGFVDGQATSEQSQTESGNHFDQTSVPLQFEGDNFDQVCDLFVTSLKSGYGKASVKLRANMTLQERREKKERNLDALQSLQGDLVTSASNYNPIKRPLPSMRSKTLNLPRNTVKDLLIVLGACRWQLLSWVLDWTTLEDRCRELVANPSKKIPKEEYKPMKIDYSQFDDWSSDEEGIVYTNPTGNDDDNENDKSIDDKSIDETGVESDSENNQFNVQENIFSDEESEFDDDAVDPYDYFPKSNAPEPMDVPAEIPQNDHFLGNRGETENASVSVANETAGLLPSSEMSRSSLLETVPGLSDNSEFKPRDVKLESRFFQLSPVRSVLSTNCPNQMPDPTSEEVREILRRVVPGLNDNTFLSCPPRNVELDVLVVHVTLANQPSSSGISTMSLASGNSTTGGIIRKIEPASQSSSESTTVPIKKENETKIQYVYKHGTQTIVVDRQLTEEELSKLKFPLPNNRVVPLSNQPMTVAPAPSSIPSQSSKDKMPAIIVSRPPQPGVQPLPRVIVPAQPSSVDTLANTLISQIQTPVQLTPNGQPIKTEDAPSPGILPKFQFAFGKDSNPVKTEPGLVTVKTEPQEMNGKVVIGSAQTPQVVMTSQIAMSQKANLVATKLGQQTSHVVVPVVGNGLTSPQNRVLPGHVTLQTTASPSAASHADLIRQLNLARAQGLVVLQQWGDKQVLVHKATGRWIMRQGDGLVTVPPQALGIQSGGESVSSSPSPSPSTSTTSASPGNSMSSSTMEQLREFDSILESKFKSTTPPAEDVISSQATFVILAPRGGTFTSVPSIVKCEPVSSGFDFQQQIKSFTSSSAPASPAKPVKITSSSISASASPLGCSTVSASFAKPSPKPQEDSDTLKRIQQILDDYNEQIRNSPDLQNRPAPRRRTNGPTIVNSSDPPRRKRLSSVSPPPTTSGGSDSDVGSPSVVQISTANVLDSGQIATLKVIQQQQPSTNGDISSNDNMSGYSVLRQIVVPPGLAASLQASGRQIMVVTGPGGKKMVALKPVFVSAGSSTSVTGKFITVSASSGATCLPTRLITTSSPITSNTSTTDKSVTSAITSKAIAALKTAVPVSIGSTSITSLSSPIGIRTQGLMMSMASTSSVVMTSSPSIIFSSASSTTSSLCLPSVMHSVGSDERPGTPGLGIPMEMTPGQIMEAEISAATFLDDNPDSPFALLSSSSSLLHQRKHDDEESLTDTLPENLFTQDFQPSTSEEDCSDLDMASTHYGKRLRRLSSTSSDGMSQVHKRGRFIKVNSLDPTMLDGAHGLKRQRNLSQKSKSNQLLGISLGESSQFLNN